MKNRTIYHWLIVAACCFNTLTAIGLMYNSTGIFFTPIADSLGIGRGDIAMFSTILSISCGLSGPFVVRLIKSNNINKLMALGVIMAGAGFALLSTAENVWLFYIVAPFMGIGQSLYGMMPLAIIIGNWFKEKHGLAMGIAYSFSGLGGAVFNPILSSVILNHGWRTGFFIMGIMALVLSLPGCLFIIRLTPAERGLLPYGGTEPIFSQPKAAAAAKSGGKHAELFSIIFSVPFLLICVYGMCNNMIPSISSHISGYALSAGLTATDGATLMSAIMVGNITSKLIIGMLSDKIGPIKACSVMICSAVSALAFFAFVPASEFAVLLVVSVFFGACYSVGAVGTPLVIRRTFGNERYASAYSYLSFFTCLTSSFMTSVVGYIYDATGSYRAAFILCMTSGIIALVLINVLGNLKQKPESPVLSGRA